MKRNCFEGHTGYVLSFSRKFLLNYQLPTFFEYGGEDYFLVNAIIGRCLNYKKLITEYKKIRKIPLVYAVIDSLVVHRYHPRNREVDFSMYN